MLLIADSGSTKTDWRFLTKNEEISFQTIGLNPHFLNDDQIQEVITSLPLDKYEVGKCFFYGAGLGSTSQQERFKTIFQKIFTDAQEISVASDMHGAALSLFNNNTGIACILGTGANSCVFDGQKIVQNVASLGYILSDWGSGAVLGKALLSEILTQRASFDLIKDFFECYPLRKDEIIQQIYRGERPNQFMAQLTPFIRKHYGKDTTCTQIVDQQFEEFFAYYLMQYQEVKEKYPIKFIGSVAFHFQEELKKTASLFDLEIASFHQSPMQGLIEYHQRELK